MIFSGKRFAYGESLLPVLMVLCLSGPARSQEPLSAVERLLQEIPSADTGDANRYCITDVQYALDADLSWNPLLKRAVLRENKSGLSFTLIVGSRLGRVGTRLVEWEEAPVFHDGQIYVSAGLLEEVLEQFPDFRLPGENENLSPSPPPSPDEPFEAVPPEEPPGVRPGTEGLEVENLFAVVCSTERDQVEEVSPVVVSATRVFIDALEKSLQSRNITLEVAEWDEGRNVPMPAPGADAMIAFRIRCATPAPKTVFFTYESASLPGRSGTPLLYEWSAVDRVQETSSRELAETLYDVYIREFGEFRSVGMRSGPFELLQGQRVPAVLVRLGIDLSDAEPELRKAAEWVAEALSMREGN